MSSHKWEGFDPFTRRQIELQPWDTGYGTDPPTLRTCGCEVWGERWHLCQFHEGVEDGASEVRAEVERLTMMHLSAESELVSAQEREKMLRKEVVRLTAELNRYVTAYGEQLKIVTALEIENRRLTAELAEADKLLRVHEATDDARLAAAEAREQALRAIPDAVRAGHSLPMQAHQAIDTITELRRKLAEGQDAHRFWSDAALLAAVKLTQAEAREKSLRELVLEVVEAMPDWWDAGEAAVSYWTQRLNEVT